MYQGHKLYATLESLAIEKNIDGYLSEITDLINETVDFTVKTTHVQSALEQAGISYRKREG